MVRGHLFHRSFSHNAQSTGGLTRTKHLWSHAHKALVVSHRPRLTKKYSLSECCLDHGAAVHPSFSATVYSI